MDQYEAALAQAVTDVEKLRDVVDMLRARMAAIEGQIAKLVAAAEALSPLVVDDKRNEYRQRLQQIITGPAKNYRGGTAYEAIVAMMNRLPSREWTAPEVQEKLLENGIPVEIEQVHNVLNYLMRKGRMTRTSRGRYVPSYEQKLVTG